MNKLGFHEQCKLINQTYKENSETIFLYTGQKWVNEPVRIKHITPYWGEYVPLKGDWFAGELFNLEIDKTDGTNKN